MFGGAFFARVGARLVSAHAPLAAGLAVVAAPRQQSRAEEEEAPPPTFQRARKNDFPISEHHHGKTRVRVLKVTRDDKDPVQRINEYTVQTTLWSPKIYEKVFTKGDNDQLVATDTQKNTVYVIAKRTPAQTPEDFGIALAAHFLAEYPWLTKVEIEVEQSGWTRFVDDKSAAHDHAWLKSPDRDAAIVTHVRGTQTPEVVSQIRQMTFLKTTQSGFEGYLVDKYTKLPFTRERCLASELSAEWHYSPASSGWFVGGKTNAADYAAIRADVKKCIYSALFGPAAGGHYSPSLQTTIYDAGCLALETVPTLAKIAIDTPNLHYLPAKFLADVGGEPFADDVFIPTNEPSGSIYCCINRK
mmetsp:Transcript_22307/g.88550  ORF Transcript_22307/g.88550 Transcript_22307/m.88550 type:complete len:358 (-) Transcript_22307:246-1319(-)